MQIAISQFNYWCKALESVEHLDLKIEVFGPEENAPKLDWVPAMQRRRLSDYAKMALFVAANSMEQNPQSSLPVVFASQHGDFHRTSKILKELAHENALSPTSFGLSVHNAVIGLYSILTKNQQPMNSIAAGEDTLIMALVDAYTQLVNNDFEQVLVVFCDQRLPADYMQFNGNNPCDFACSFIVSKETSNGIILNLENAEGKTTSTMGTPIEFAQFISAANKSDSVTLGCDGRWQLTVNEVISC